MEKVQREICTFTTGVWTIFGNRDSVGSKINGGFAFTKFKSWCGKQISGQINKLISCGDKCYKETKQGTVIGNDPLAHVLMGRKWAVRKGKINFYCVLLC